MRVFVFIINGSFTISLITQAQNSFTAALAVVARTTTGEIHVVREYVAHPMWALNRGH